MPRLTPSEYEMQNRITKATISSAMIMQNVKPEMLAKALGISLSSVNRKRANPEQFTLAEIRALVKYLRMNDEQKIKVLGFERVSA